MIFVRESWAGIEPAHGGFANHSVSTSPPGLGKDYFTIVFNSKRQEGANRKKCFIEALFSIFLFLWQFRRYVDDVVRRSQH